MNLPGAFKGSNLLLHGNLFAFDLDKQAAKYIASKQQNYAEI